MKQPDERSRRRFLKASSMLGLTVAISPAAIAKTFLDSEPRNAQKEGAMSNNTAEKNEIRPFHVHVPEAEIAELRRRIKATRWPERETVTDDSQGVQLPRFRRSPIIGQRITIGASARPG